MCLFLKNHFQLISPFCYNMNDEKLHEDDLIIVYLLLCISFTLLSMIVRECAYASFLTLKESIHLIYMIID
jgi:hypothetical protein